MILVLGEILFDELPSGRRPGGAPFNVAQHLSRLGLDVHFISRVGNDERGEALLEAVKAAGLDPKYIQRDPDHETGRVGVELDAKGVPTYDIVKDVAYDHIDFEALDSACGPVDLIYFGSLIQRTEAGRKRLQDFLDSLPYGIMQFYDMNLREECDTIEILEPSLRHTDILKLNEEELTVAGRLLNLSGEGDALAEALMSHCSIKQLALTRGPEGASLFANGQRYDVEATPMSDDEIADTVGAGDAFSSMLAWGLQQGLRPQDALQRASDLAEYVCTISGAVPPDNTIYERLTT